ncbi:winged helix-turn-helix domain-containing protein [Mollicutes bacterium LVI A0039]|nr:winged helix-turn-helix domain-containing protein [Mollicutes bacterium LVI A0039]
MKVNGLIIAVNLANCNKLKEMYPSISFINLEDLDTIFHFNAYEVITLIIDVDNVDYLTLVEIKQLQRRYHDKLIFTSDSYMVLRKYNEYGFAVHKNSKVLGEQIMQIYSNRIKREDAHYVFDYENRKVIFADTVYELRNTPFLILSYLVKNKNRTCSREELIKAVGGSPKLAESRTIDVHINYIRNTIGDRRIKTVVSEGYTFDDMH